MDSFKLLKEITSTDSFVFMPLSTQSLYFHLCINAESERGMAIVTNPMAIMRSISAARGDLWLLKEKGYISLLNNGVCKIEDWRFIE